MYIGMYKEVVDASNGVATTFHRINSFNVDYITNQIYLMVGKYVSQEMYSNGKNFVTVESIILPMSDSMLTSIDTDTLYSLIVAKESSSYFGATLVS